MTALLVLGMSSSVSAFAYGTVDVSKKAALNLKHCVEDQPIGGVEFKLYRVADMTPDAKFHVVTEFEDARVSMSTDAAEESWSARAITLDSYLIQRRVEGAPIFPVASAITDETGRVMFSNLEVGLYLLIGEPKKIGKKVYTPLVTLISLPCLDASENWDYSPSVQTKIASDRHDREEIDISVVKVWKDTGHEKQRPSEVTVTLYGDDEEYSTVTLSEQTDWKHVWRGVDGNVVWKLVERNVPSNYHVVATREKMTFIVTNTFVESTPDRPEEPSHSLPPLPQTGQLWWPVPYLSAGGLVVLLLGIKTKSKGDNHHVSK